MAKRKTVSVVLPMWIYEELTKFAEQKDWSVSQTAKNLIVSGLGLEDKSKD